jgi:hypothetical protein
MSKRVLARMICLGMGGIACLRVAYTRGFYRGADWLADEWLRKDLLT